nr:rod shape-determining protein MreD [Nocardioides perillae]
MLRAAVTALALLLALVLQLTVFPHVAWAGVVPNLCLLVVVGTALARGPDVGAATGLAAGLLLDLAPPADHLAGRWAIALVLVGWVVGRVRAETRTPTSVVATVAVASFVGTSVFALSGVLLGEPVGSVATMLAVVAVAVVWDVLLTPFVLPPLLAVLARLDGRRRPERRDRGARTDRLERLDRVSGG